MQHAEQGVRDHREVLREQLAPRGVVREVALAEKVGPFRGNACATMIGGQTVVLCRSGPRQRAAVTTRADSRALRSSLQNLLVGCCPKRTDRRFFEGGAGKDRLHRRYCSYEPRTYVLPKADGSTRTIQAYFGRDKLAQRAVLHVLEPLGEQVFSDNAYGYRPGCTADMVLSRVREDVRRGFLWLADLDVRQCFDRIYRPALLKQLTVWCGHEEIAGLVERWCVVGLSGAERHRGIPQGMVLSPFLCNVYLHRLDLGLEREGIRFVRFADDVLLMAQSERDAQAALAFAEAELNALKLELNPHKTAVFRTSRHHRFLGQRLPRAPKAFSLVAALGDTLRGKRHERP